MIQSTQRKKLRPIIQTKRRYKKIGSNTHNDQDSDVSFENDLEEEIDTTEIEEEDWIEYMKRSTNDAIEKMENAKIRCWNKTHKKNEMETGAENSNITE